MTWSITVQDALFLVAIVIFGLNGYRRGWRREIVSLLSLVLGLVFLLMNGGAYMARLLYQLLLDVNLTEHQLIVSHPRFVLITTLFALALIVGLGYPIGRRRFSGPASSEDRTLGFLLGAFIGVFVAAYVTVYLLPDTRTSVITRVTIRPLNIGPYLIADFTAVL